MNKSNILKISAVIYSSLMISGCVTNCTSTKVSEMPEETVLPVMQETPEPKTASIQVPQPQPVQPQPPVVQETPKQEITVAFKQETVNKKPVTEDPVPAEKKEEPVVVEPEPEPEPEPVVEAPAPEPEEDEYTRSVKQLADGAVVDHETFNKDKADVLAVIEELENVMKTQDYKVWLTYLDDASIAYWSKRTNLQKAQKRLPIKGLKIDSLQDYFTYIFIPSRQGHKMEEIRYETDKQVKAVQTRKDEEGKYIGDTVYYYLRKINGQWKLHLPEIK